MKMRKYFSLKEVKRKSKALKRRKKKIVFTNGCFDIIHPGHIYSLKKAKAFGDILIVGLNSDQSVKKLKGRKRPFFPLKDRLAVLSAIEYIDYLISFDDSTPEEVIKSLKPDILVKGCDYQLKDIVGSRFVKSYGGKVKRIPIYKKYSTSSIIKSAVR